MLIFLNRHVTNDVLEIKCRRFAAIFLVTVVLGLAGLLLQFTTLLSQQGRDGGDGSSLLKSRHSSSSRWKKEDDDDERAAGGGVNVGSSLSGFAPDEDDDDAIDVVLAAWSKSWESVLAVDVNTEADWKGIWRGGSSGGINPLNFTRPDHVSELFKLFPPPKRSKTLQIYNDKTFAELVRTLYTNTTTTLTTGSSTAGRTGGGGSSIEKATGKITIVANGGSDTAGGGGVGFDDRYYAQFARYLSQLDVTPSASKFNIFHRGHGTRHSLHSAVFAANFLPQSQKVDVLLWEFAINDHGRWFADDDNTKNRQTQQRSILIAWLTEVSKMKPNPPYVILVYLWRTPFGYNYNRNGRMIENPVFDSHVNVTATANATILNVAQNFDFVVGHVNVASYFDELMDNYSLNFDLEKLNRTFIADIHHNNKLGHLVESYLLLYLLNRNNHHDDGSMWSSDEKGKQREERQEQRQQQKRTEERPEPIEKYDTYCGDGDAKKKFVRNRVVEEYDNDNGVSSSSSSTTGWRSPLGSMTLEQPRNEIDTEATSQRQLILVHPKSSDDAGRGFSLLSKASSYRNDRVWSVEVACCDDGANAHANYTTVSVPSGYSRPMENVRGVFFTFGRQFSQIDKMNMFMNDETTTPAAGYMFATPRKDWKCYWSSFNGYDAAWFAFDENQSTPTSSLSFCIKNKFCRERTGTGSNVKMISMAVYAT